MVIAACGSGAAHRGRTVVYASGADLQSVNPLLTVHPFAKQVERYVLLTTLVGYVSALVPRPYLARAWTWSEDRKSLTFRLQPGVRWGDGVPTTARDVAWTLSAPRRAFFFQAEDGIRARTVTGVQTCALPISAKFRPLQRADVERGLHPAVPELRGVGVLIAVAGRRRQRRRQDDVRSRRAVHREGRVRAVAEQADVHPRLELFGALRLQHVGRLLTAGEQPAQAVLRRGDARALRDPAEDPREERGGCDVGRRLRARLTVGDADFSEREPRPLADRLGEGPRGASLGEPRPP